MGSPDADRARIDRLFKAALDRPAPERAAFLDRACAGDAELRASVDELLRLSAQEDLDADLRALHDGQLLRELVSESLPAGEVANRTLPPGTRIGAYRVVEELGRGGMGVVYLAERVEGEFEQRVAVKVLRADLAGALILRRFQEERTILASLNHPHVARLYGGGTAADGRPYFTMEFVDGVPIDRYCRDRGLPLDQRLELLEKVALAVHYAHRNLIVHRDLKPSNIFVAADGEPKLLDFGIAKLAGSGGGGEAATRLLERRLTPEYASPELLRGEVVTTASDVYQLGLILYELLTGTPAHTPPASPSSAAWEQTVCDREPRLPSAAARDGGPGSIPSRLLRGDLDNIVMMALRKEPAERYASAEQLAQDLRRHLSSEPVLAHRPTLGYRARKFAARNKLAVAAAALVLLSLLAGVVGTSWQAGVARRERDATRMEAATADRVTGFLLGLFEVADPSESRGRTVTAQELLTRGVERIDTELSSEPAIRARLLDALGRVHHSLGLNAEAERLLEQALELRRDTFGDRHLEVAESLVSLASFLCDRRDCSTAEPLFREALIIRRELEGGESVGIARVLRGLGVAAQSLGRFEEAEELLVEAMAMNERYLGRGNPETAMTRADLGLVMHSRGELDETERLYREALEVLQDTLGDDHPQTLLVLSNLTVLLRHQGDSTAAEPLMRRLLVAQRRNFGDRHERVATLANNLGVMLADEGKFDEAEELVREALEIRTELLGAGASSLTMTVVNLGYVLHLEGDLEGALPIYEQAVELGLTGRPDHPQLGVASFWCGKLLAETGRHADAEPHLRRALEIYRQVYGEGDAWSLDAQIALGRSVSSQGRVAEAERLLVAGLESAEPESEQHVAALAALVELYERGDRPAEADRYRAVLEESSGTDQPTGP